MTHIHTYTFVQMKGQTSHAVSSIPICDKKITHLRSDFLVFCLIGWWELVREVAGRCIATKNHFDIFTADVLDSILCRLQERRRKPSHQKKKKLTHLQKQLEAEIKAEDRLVGLATKEVLTFRRLKFPGQTTCGKIHL